MSLVAAPKKKPSAAARKRAAGHHRHNKHYLKTYWPYLPMLAIVAVGLLVNSALSMHHVLGANADFSASSFLADTNQQRSADHESALTLSSDLTAAAQAKANDMVAKNYWSHNSPSGVTPWAFIAASGYQYQSAGENLAYGFGDASQVVAAWMNSAEHRANILNANYQNVGFGVAQSPNFQGQGPATIVVAEYGQPSNSSVNVSFTVPPHASATPAAVKGTELNAQRVSRVQLWTGGSAAWSLAAVSAIAGAAFMLFVVRHGYRLHRMLIRGEFVVASHPYFDIAIVFVFVAGYILTRTSGLIH